MRLAWLVVLGGALVAGACTCATPDAVRLVHPPAAPNAAFPGGVRLLTKAPLGDWEVVAGFASRAECEEARQAATEDTISRARALAGDDAKYDLDVRRAVNARCVGGVPPRTPER